MGEMYFSGGQTEPMGESPIFSNISVFPIRPVGLNVSLVWLYGWFDVGTFGLIVCSLHCYWYSVWWWALYLKWTFGPFIWVASWIGTKRLDVEVLDGACLKWSINEVGLILSTRWNSCYIINTSIHNGIVMNGLEVLLFIVVCFWFLHWMVWFSLKSSAKYATYMVDIGISGLAAAKQV